MLSTSGGHYLLSPVIGVLHGLRTQTCELTRPLACVLATCILSAAIVPVYAQSANTSTSSPTREGALYQSVGPSVFRIESGLSHGSGFLIDSDGLVATNDHVLGTGQDVSVYVDSATRVAATVVSRDPNADIAFILVAPSVVRGRPPLALATPPVILRPGDRVLALGYPLNQPLTISAGMVANVRAGALLTDATINPGNSGGPILTLDGLVVAVATFREVDERAIGPGLGGGVLIDRLQELRPAGRASAIPPSDRRLPSFPLTTYPVSALKSVADTIDPLLFETAGSLNSGPFAIAVSTPISRMLSALTIGRSISRDRRKRESRAGVPETQRYADLGELRDWAAYVGNETAPVVAIKVEPLFGETGGSAFRRGLLGGPATLRYQGDVQKVTLRRNGKTIEPLRGGHAPVPIAVQNSAVDFKDVADFGYYLYPPEAFRPDVPQVPPEITLVIEDLKNPTTPRHVRLPNPVVARMWNDFEGYFRHTNPQSSFARYRMIKSCNVDNGASAMLGAQSTPVAGETQSCSYIVAPQNQPR